METIRTTPLILIADSNAFDVQQITAELRNKAYVFSTVDNIADLEPTIVQTMPQVVLLSYESVLERRGIEILLRYSSEYPDTKFIIVSNTANPERIISCIKCGAFDYLVKPISSEALNKALGNSIRQLREERMQKEINQNLSSRQDIPEAFSPYVGESLITLAVLQKASAYSKRLFPVLLQGESGLGKQLLARLIHNASGRNGDFVSVSVQGLSDEDFYRECYAVFRRCNGGTVYFSDISRVSLHQQRFIVMDILQNQRLHFPYSFDIPDFSVADCRLIFGASRPLEPMLQEQKFDEKLYYRLTTNSIMIVPLRENRNDIPVLLDYFLESFAQKMNKTKPSYPKELVSLLKSYFFPGNIAELSAMIENALALHDRRMLSTSTFSRIMNYRRNQIELPSRSGSTFAQCLSRIEPFIPLKEAKKHYFDEALRRSENNQAAAAKLLGITRQAVNNYVTTRMEADGADAAAPDSDSDSEQNQ